MKTFILISLFLLSVSHRASGAEVKPQLVFIVNKSNPVNELSVKEISDLYFKKNRFWKDGSKVRFLDGKSSSTSKKTFLSKVLKKTPRDLELFWIGQKNFTGQGAPLEVPDEETVVSSVSTLPGAIGYVTNSEDLDLSGVKKVTVKGME